MKKVYVIEETGMTSETDYGIKIIECEERNKLGVYFNDYGDEVSCQDYFESLDVAWEESNKLIIKFKERLNKGYKDIKVEISYDYIDL